MSRIRIINPYENLPGQWVRANFHGHCREHSGCSNVPLAEGIRKYREVGAKVITVTDHDHITDLAAARAQFPDTVFLEGFEYSRSHNLLFIGKSVPPLYTMTSAEAMRHAADLLTIICHPQPHGQEREYWTREEILLLARLPDGIEIFNGHYGIPRMLDEGHVPLYTKFWDSLLSAGLRLWGFTNDDFHEPPDFNNAWNMVCVPELTAEAVLAAARAGHFYGTTGLLAEQIDADGPCIRVRTASACTGRFIGLDGRVISERKATDFGYTVTDEPYVRFEAESHGRRLFLQPIFRVLD